LLGRVKIAIFLSSAVYHSTLLENPLLSIPYRKAYTMPKQKKIGFFLSHLFARVYVKCSKNRQPVASLRFAT
jgi:hypothetical protein